jgi:CBS domain-containing protein
MALKYKIIRIFTGEEVHWHGKPLYNAIIEYIRSLKLAARCVIHRGIAGCYETGEISTQNILDLSYNLPVTVEILLPATELESVLSHLEAMVPDGIISSADLEIYAYHSSKRLIPGQLKVKEVMSTSLKTVTPEIPVNEIVNLMLDNGLKGIPVTDARQHPVGIITQGDLMAKAGMPVRLGLLKKLETGRTQSFLKGVAGKTARDIMSRTLTTIKEEQTLREAVQMMLRQQLKRLPVISAEGKLVGMIARIDVFQTITKQAPQWQFLQEQNIVLNNNQPVSNVLPRDLLTVNPDTPVPEVIEKITGNEVQRIAVVDRRGKFLGLISDSDLLPVIAGQPGLWDVIISKLTFIEKGRRLNESLQHVRARTAAEVMAENVMTIQEDAPIDEAVKLMAEKGLKRLPVVDKDGIFKGLISRDSVLQTAIK